MGKNSREKRKAKAAKAGANARAAQLTRNVEDPTPAENATVGASESTKAHPQETRKSPWKKWGKPMAILTLLLLFNSAYNTWIVEQQRKNAEASSQEAARQTNRLIENSNAIAKSMEASVTQAREALDVSIETARRDQRAWITVPSIFVTNMGANQKIQIRVMAGNSGKTPATVHIYGALFMDDKFPKDKVFTEEEWGKVAPPVHAIIGPGVSYPFNFDGRVLTESEVKAI